MTSAAPPRPVRVLVVEDDGPTGHALALLLKHHRYEVISAHSVAEAVGRLTSEPAPDAVLLDLMLPDGDGLKVLETIRQRRLPSQVTVITGVGDLERLECAMRLNPRAVLQKPVDFPQILAQLPPAG